MANTNGKRTLQVMNLDTLFVIPYGQCMLQVIAFSHIWRHIAGRHSLAMGMTLQVMHSLNFNNKTFVPRQVIDSEAAGVIRSALELWETLVMRPAE